MMKSLNVTYVKCYSLVNDMCTRVPINKSDKSGMADYTRSNEL